MIDHAIYNLLSNDATVSGMVGSRIYAVVMPQEPTLPAIQYSRVSTFSRSYAHDGSCKVAKSRFQFNCYAEDALEAKQLSEAVRILFHAYTGTVVGETIFNATVENELDLYDQDLTDYSAVLDIVFFHKEN